MKKISIKKLSLVSLFLASFSFFPSAWAATYTVKTTGDTDLTCTLTVASTYDCKTLRGAITAANANSGPDNISFAIDSSSDAGCIPSSGVCTIQPALAELPTITDPVAIDGYTQPGAIPASASAAASLKIELNGSLLGPANGLVLNTDDSAIKGLVINSFKGIDFNISVGNGVLLMPNSDRNVISGNYIGLDVTGTLDKGNGYNGIFISDSNYNMIGGDNPSDRNIISGQDTILADVPYFGVIRGGSGVFIRSESSFNVVKGNYIGTDASGTYAIDANYSPILSPMRVFIQRAVNISNTTLSASGTHHNLITKNVLSGNKDGGLIVFDRADHNTFKNNLVGTDPTGTILIGNAEDGLEIGKGNNNILEGNVVAGSANVGIPLLSAENNVVKGNFIGTDKTKTLNFGNKTDGIRLLNGGLGGSINNMIINNVIANNTNRGVNVVDILSWSNAILSNSIYNNSLLGIDLGNNGVTLNDSDDSDTGANNLQNFPVLNAAKSFINPEKAKVYGSLDSKPKQQYLIQIFANAVGDASSNGEGQVFLGEKVVTTDSAGHVDFKIEADKHAPVVKDPNTGACSAAPVLTATATDVLTGDTSEFSQWVSVDVKGSANAYSKRCKEKEKHADDDDDANEHARGRAHDND